VAQIQPQTANQTSQIQAAIQNLTDAESGLVSQIISNNPSCDSTNTTAQNSSAVPCGAAALSQAQTATNAVTNALPSIVQAISQLSSLIPGSSLLQSIPTQVLQVELRFIQCLQQALPAIG
jgi:hypothetical protein